MLLASKVRFQGITSLVLSIKHHKDSKFCPVAYIVYDHQMANIEPFNPPPKKKNELSIHQSTKARLQ